MMDSKCTLRNAKVCAFLHKCVYSDNFDQPMSTTQNPNQYICLCTSFKFYLDFQRSHEFFSKSVADLVHALAMVKKILVRFIYSEKATKFLQNLHLRFDWHYIEQIYGGDFSNFCGLLRKYEL